MHNSSPICIACEDKFCCKMETQVSKKEIEAIAEYIGIDVETFSYIAINNGNLRISSNGFCLFHQSGRCALGISRPYICKTYICDKLG